MNQEAWLEVVKIFSRMNELLVHGEIFGHLPSGKNNYRIVGKRMIKDINVSAYERDAIPQLTVLKNRTGVKDIDFDVALIAKVWFRSHRRDVDTILFCDLLQKSGIIKNDRSIKIKIMNGVDVDPKNPRVEFGLLRLR